MKIYKILPLLCFGLIACAIADDYQDQLESCLSTKEQPLSANDNAMLWYKTSAERTALFRQTFDHAYDQINRNIKSNKYAPNTWGIVIGLDNTIFDTSNYKLAQYLGCTADNGSDFMNYAMHNTFTTLPEAADFSCSIQALGGKVIIVSNRNAGNNDNDVINSTESNLAAEKVCYDSIIFANGASDTNKNPRFNAITSGDYENVIATSKYTIPLNIVAYIGSDIEDFPDLKQQILRSKSENESDFDKFGTEYFILPNPISGSWRTNYWK